MTLNDILSEKGSHVYTVSPAATLDDVVQKLVECNCGSLLVCEPAPGGGQSILGIITERDILRACAAHLPLAEVPVENVMTRNLVTGHPDDSVEEVMGLLTEKRIRHLPVLNQGCLVGLISIGDVVKAQYRQTLVENHYLKTYLHG